MDAFEDNDVQEELADAMSMLGDALRQIAACNDAVVHGMDDSALEKIESDLIGIQMELLGLYNRTLPKDGDLWLDIGVFKQQGSQWLCGKVAYQVSDHSAKGVAKDVV